MKSYTGTGYTIYAHVNKQNGKMYIGQTCQRNLKHRWENGVSYSMCTHFYSAIQKYGWDGFDHVILQTGLTAEEANAYERAYISFFETTNPDRGYNIQPGGCSAGGMSEEGRLSYRKKRAGLNSQNQRAVVVFNCSGEKINEFPLGIFAAAHYGINHSTLFTHLSHGRGTCHNMIFRYKDDVGDMTQLPPNEVFRPHEKPTLRHPKKPPKPIQPRQRDMSKRWKAVSMYSREGEFLRSFKNAEDAASDVGTSIKNIYGACTNNYSSGGFLWRYDNGDHSPITPPPARGQLRKETGGGLGRSIDKLDPHTGEILATFVSIHSAARSCNCDRAGIGKVLHGVKKTCGGFMWKYHS